MLDMQHIWERVFRRAHLELAYSQGFHPQPRIQQAAPLPLGFLSSFEILDFWLEGENMIERVTESIQTAIQSGLEIIRMEIVDLSLPPLQTVLQTATYQVTDLLSVNPDEFILKKQQFLEQSSIFRERRGKTYDLRPLVLGLDENIGSEGALFLVMCLTARDAATGRPDEVIAALGYDPFGFRYLRVELGFSGSIFP
jgi:radical SAM-linked protein